MVYYGMFYVTIITEFTIRFYVNYIYKMFILSFWRCIFAKRKGKKHRLFLSQRHAFIMICRRRADLLAHCYTKVYSSKLKKCIAFKLSKYNFTWIDWRVYVHCLRPSITKTGIARTNGKLDKTTVILYLPT